MSAARALDELALTGSLHDANDMTKFLDVGCRRYRKGEVGHLETGEGGDIAGFSAADKRRKHRSAVQRKSKQTTEVTRSTLTDEDDDDAASVCSSLSSASEKSQTSRGSGGTGGGKSHRRPRCPVHSGRTGKREENDREGSRSGNSSETCTCRTNRRKPNCSRQTTTATTACDKADGCTIVTRPEPEGGLPSVPCKSAMDDFDRLIYGPSEPLFSDCDETGLGEIAEVSELRPDCDRVQRRRVAGCCGRGGGDDVADSTEGLFSAAQMVNSNNLMKFAIIQTELKNVKDVSMRRAENDVTSMWRRVEAVQEGFSQTASTLHNASGLLADIQALRDAASEKDQENSSTSAHSDRLVGVAGRRSAASNSKQGVQYHTTVTTTRRRLLVTDIDIERTTASLDAAERRVSELEGQLKVVVGKMSGTGSTLEQHTEKAIRDITLRLKEAENRAAAAERSIYSDRRQATRHKDEVMAEKKKYQPVGSLLSSTTFTELTGC